MAKNYLFGGNTGLSYEQLKRSQAYADDMQKRGASGQPKNAIEGINSAASSIMGALLAKKLGKQEQAGRDEFSSTFQGLLGGYGGNPGTLSTSTYGGGTYAPAPANPTDPITNEYPTGTPAPAPARMDQYGIPSATAENTQPDFPVGAPVAPDLKGGIVETANALGISPHDLATAISYETAGTFDPAQPGPTTQWGQHKGLIQFGEPQAKEYGVDWNDPMGSQLGADGAVAKYLRKAGVQPGMGLMDVYSAINAGSVGRNGASDANNGGAPGTVADKVNTQMAGHAEKAAALLGGTWTPSAPSNVTMSAKNAPQQGGGGLNPALIEALGNPYATDGQRMVLGQLLQQQLAASAPVDQMKALQMQKLQAEVGNIQNGGALNVGAQEILYDGTVVRSTNKGVQVIGADNVELTGQAAKDAIVKAREQQVANQRATFGARREGTLGADINLGGEAAATADLGKAGAAAGMSAWETYGKLQTGLSNIDEAIGAIDSGANSGMVYNMLPSITLASASLENSMSRMGLDVVGSVTFGALSEGEMRLAMSTAVPQNLGPAELRQWLVKRRSAQEKAAITIADAAEYLTDPKNTINGWIKRNKDKASGRQPPQGGAQQPMSDEDLLKQYGGGN